MVSGVASFPDPLRRIPSLVFVLYIMGKDGLSLLVCPLVELMKSAPEQESDWGGEVPRVGSRVGSWLLKSDI